MRTLRINEPHDLHRLFEVYKSREGLGWFFRGQADSSWPLIPKAGRPDLNNGRDLGRFNYWCDRAVACRELPDNIWERLVIAQHYGLATRLLDWTFNPLVACFFGVSDFPTRDGAVYAHFPTMFVDQAHQSIENIDEVIALIPRAIDIRILRQSGGFTVHPRPAEPMHSTELTKPFTGPNLVKIVIPSSTKGGVREMLESYGVNFAAMFPDLEGLSKHTNWRTAEMVRIAQERSSGEAV
jgi:hypothetical protein